MNKDSFLTIRASLFPLNVTPLVTILIMLFAVKMFDISMFGIAFVVVAIPLFIKYAYIILEHASKDPSGEAPMLGIETLNPTTEYRPTIQAFVLVLLYYSFLFLQNYFGPLTSYCFLSLALMVLPANILLIGTTENLALACHPKLLFSTMKELNWKYLDILFYQAMWAVVIFIGYQLSLHQYLLLFILAYAIYANYYYMGSKAYSVLQPEREKHQQQIEASKKAPVKLKTTISNQQMLDHAYRLYSVGDFHQAITDIKQHIHNQENLVENYQWFFKQLSTWQHKKFACLFSEYYVDLLLQAQARSEAWKMMQTCFNIQEDYQPESPHICLLISQLAKDFGQPQKALQLLENFAEQYHDDTETADAEQLYIQLLLNHTNEHEKAQQMIQKFIIRFPRHEKTEELKSLLKTMKI